MAAQGFSFAYDVFLSFSGPDTRTYFTGHLYQALQGNGIRTFVDDRMLQRGEEISQTLINSIQKSQVAIVILSENYAASAWCLNELVMIMECVKGKGRLIVPVFYGVDPQDVRYLRGSYGEAFDKQRERFKYCHAKLLRWALALHEAANISGFHINPGYGFESELIGRIVEVILSKISRPALPVANYPVRLQSRLLELNSLLDAGSDQNVRMIGIWGAGGMGKTTLAKAVYDDIAHHFEGLSFLRDVRESCSKRGLVKLQERLLSDVLQVEDSNIKLVDVNQGISILKRMLSGKKVLIVLDDVSDLEQLQAIAGGCEWFGPGSRIIITTRGRRVLLCHGVGTMFKVKPWKPQEALDLFSWNAFRTNAVDPSYTDASRCALLYAKGLPLALEVIGSNLYGKTMNQWESVLCKYGRIAATATLSEILRVSYEDLDLVQKAIFLDIACFFKGHRLEYVSNILQSIHGFTVDNVIGMLVGKSLIRIECGVLRMHDLIQDMGREIVLQQLCRDMGGEIILKPSRLGPFKVSRPRCEDVSCVSKENKQLECLSLSESKSCEFPSILPDLSGVSLTELHLGRRKILFEIHVPCGFLDQVKLRRLSIERCAKLKSLHLLVLSGCSSLQTLPHIPLKHFEYLFHLDISSCKLVRELPDLSGAPNLKVLRLDHCKNLIRIRGPLGSLHKLRRLSINGCTQLNTTPHAVELTSLGLFDVSSLSTLRTYSQISRKMGNIGKADLVGTIVQELPQHEMIRAKPWSEFQFSSKHKRQWDNLTLLSCVTHLDVSACNLSDQFLVYLACFPNLKNLNLRANNFTTLPACIKQCSHLSYLSLDDCKKLQKIEEIPPNIELFRASNCTSLTQTSCSKLLNQDLHKAGNTQIVLPGSRIPEWFDHFNGGGSLSFWVRKKFPPIALCFVLGCFNLQHGKFKLKLRMLINGKFQFDFDYNYFLALVTDHIMLFDLQSQMANNELDEILLDEEWNHVQVSCVEEPSLKGIMSIKETIKCIGVYRYKPQSRVKDIHFANPCPGKRKDNLLCCADDVELNCYPLLKKQRNTPNLHLQNNLGSMAQNIPIRFKTAFEDRGKYSTLYDDAGMKWDIDWLSLLPSMQPMEVANMISNSIVSKTTSDFCSEEDVKLDEFFNRRVHLEKRKRSSGDWVKPAVDIGVQSAQTCFESDHATLPSVSKDVDGSPVSMENYMDHFEFCSNDIAVEEPCASLEYEMSALSSVIDPETNTEYVNTKMSAETKKALKFLQDCVSKRFCLLLDPGRSRFMNIVLEYLLSLSEDDGVSLKIRSAILQVSRSFTQWSRDYAAASVKRELKTAEMSNVDKLEADIEANVKNINEVDLLEDELRSELACLEESKRKLEEHIRVINEQIKEFRLPRGTVSVRKPRHRES